MPRIIEAVQKAKGGPIQYLQGVPNKVASECVCVCVHPRMYSGAKKYLVIKHSVQ